MLGTNVGIVWPPHIQQWPTMPNNVGICWDKCWHRLARALLTIACFAYFLGALNGEGRLKKFLVQKGGLF